MKPKRSWPKSSGTYDECGTPAYAFLPMDDLMQETTIWEPAPGEGLLSAAMRACGHKVVETHSDFFETGWPDGAQVLVTNPPYSIKYKWLDYAMSFDMPVALLLPLESIGTLSMWDATNGLAPSLRIILPRVNFKMPDLEWDGSGAQFPTAWFMWNWGGWEGQRISVVRQSKQEREWKDARTDDTTGISGDNGGE